MDNFTTLQIIVKESKSTNNKNNKNLFKFLNLNYQEILQSQYYIQLVLLNKSNYKSFTNRINNTPALIHNETIITGTYNIINYLIKLCEGKEYNEEEEEIKPTNNFSNKVNVDNNEFLHDFLLTEALKDDTIEEPLDLNKVKDKENKYKLKQEKQKKINPKLNNSIISTSKFNDQNNNKSIDNISSFANLTTDEKTYIDNSELTKTRPISDYMSDDKDLQKFWDNIAETE
jgi:hypothetical protein